MYLPCISSNANPTPAWKRELQELRRLRICSPFHGEHSLSMPTERFQAHSAHGFRVRRALESHKITPEHCIPSCFRCVGIPPTAGIPTIAIAFPQKLNRRASWIILGFTEVLVI